MIVKLCNPLFCFQATPHHPPCHHPSCRRSETLPFRTWREMFLQPVFSESEFSCLERAFSSCRPSRRLPALRCRHGPLVQQSLHVRQNRCEDAEARLPGFLWGCHGASPSRVSLPLHTRLARWDGAGRPLKRPALTQSLWATHLKAEVSLVLRASHVCL